jgi:hypothetical protein
MTSGESDRPAGKSEGGGQQCRSESLPHRYLRLTWRPTLVERVSEPLAPVMVSV